MSSVKIFSHSIPIFENLTEEDVKTKMKDRKPFVIRGYDIGPCKDTWTAEYISGKMGQIPVKIHVSAHQKLDFVKKNFLYKTLPFDELMRRIGRRENENFFIQSNELYYLRSLGPDRRGKEVANLMKDFPQIAQDFNVPKFFDENDFFSAVLRISSAGIQLWTHYDIMDNILIQIRGEKKLILWPPSEVDNLYLVGDKSEVVNVEEGDMEKYPKFNKATRYECTIDEGDIIYIPALWFHNVTALRTSIGVNVFWKNLPHELYDRNDSYGNKDLTVATKSFQAIENCCKSLDLLPIDYKKFYLKRMISQLEAKLEVVKKSNSL